MKNAKREASLPAVSFGKRRRLLPDLSLTECRSVCDGQPLIRLTFFEIPTGEAGPLNDFVQALCQRFYAHAKEKRQKETAPLTYSLFLTLSPHPRRADRLLFEGRACYGTSQKTFKTRKITAQIRKSTLTFCGGGS